MLVLFSWKARSNLIFLVRTLRLIESSHLSKVRRPAGGSTRPEHRPPRVQAGPPLLPCFVWVALQTTSCSDPWLVLTVCQASPGPPPGFILQLGAVSHQLERGDLPEGKICPSSEGDASSVRRHGKKQGSATQLRRRHPPALSLPCRNFLWILTHFRRAPGSAF